MIKYLTITNFEYIISNKTFLFFDATFFSLAIQSAGSDLTIQAASRQQKPEGRGPRIQGKAGQPGRKQRGDTAIWRATLQGDPGR